MRLYSEEQPQEAVAHLEAALREYSVADAECRALCEGPYDYDGYNYLEYNADLFQAIAGARPRACPRLPPGGSRGHGLTMRTRRLPPQSPPSEDGPESSLRLNVFIFTRI